MIVSITQYQGMARDGNGHIMPLGKGRLASQNRTSDGAFTAIVQGAGVVRIATDTTIHINTGGGSSSSSSEIIPGGTVEYVAVRGGEVFNIVTAS